MRRRVDAARIKLGAGADANDWRAVEAGLTARIDSHVPHGLDARPELLAALKSTAEAPNATAADAYQYAMQLANAPMAYGAAIRWLRETLRRDPGFFPAQRGLVINLFADPAAAKEQSAAAAALLEACPDESSSYAFAELLPRADAERWLDRLRTRVLPRLSGDKLATAEETEWRLAFKLIPVAQHSALRAKIGKDVAALAALTPTTAILEARLKGAELAQDGAELNTAAADLDRLFPHSAGATSHALEVQAHDFSIANDG